MMKKIFYIFSLFLITISSCKKGEYATNYPTSLAHFTNLNSQAYYVENTSISVFKVPVGLTDIADKDRTIDFTVTSPTGAASGTQYTLTNGSKIVIPAGKAIDSIPVKGIFAGYPGNRRDTLVFTLTGGDAKPSDYNKVYKLVMTKYCQVLLPSFTGAYTKCYDLQTGQPTYGPYATNITGVTSLTATTGYITVTNFWDVGGSPIRIDLDWSNPAAFKTTVPAQPLYIDPTYGQATIRPVGSGTFSSCDNTFTISYAVTVAAGSFGNFITNMGR
jgi:hypothetical protein